MGLRLGDTAPNFTAETTEGHIDFHEWLGDGWGVLMSHPADFTPVCTTELGAVGKLNAEFAKRNAKPIVVSVDSVEDHKAWSKDIDGATGCAPNFPIIGDPERTVANLYEMIHPGEGDTSTVRTVFLIDPNKKVRTMLTYPKSVGRNFAEVLRTLDALQLTDQYPVSTPSDWQVGADVVISPALSAEDAKKQFPEGWNELTPYLRLAKQPQS